MLTYLFIHSFVRLLFHYSLFTISFFCKQFEKKLRSGAIKGISSKISPENFVNPHIPSKADHNVASTGVTAP